MITGLDPMLKKTFVVCVMAMERHVKRLKEFLINYLDLVSEMNNGLP